jgi:hypothetical protein
MHPQFEFDTTDLAAFSITDIYPDDKPETPTILSGISEITDHDACFMSNAIPEILPSGINLSPSFINDLSVESMNSPFLRRLARITPAR